MSVAGLHAPPAPRLAPGDSAPARRRPRSDWAIVAGPAALALTLSCLGIASRSLGFDEAATVTIASQHGSALWSAIGHDGGNMSGYYLVLHALIGWFGAGQLLVRLPSAVAAGAGVAALQAFALRCFDRRVAVAAGLLSAISLPLVFWGQSARGYAPMVALVCGSFLAFSVLVDHAMRGRAPRWSWAAYVISTALAVYMSFLAALILPAQLASLARRRRAVGVTLTAVGAVVVCCSPLVALAWHRGSGQLFWVPAPNLSALAQILQTLTSAALVPSFPATATSLPLLVATLAAIVAATACAVRWPPHGDDERGRGTHEAAFRGDREPTTWGADEPTTWGARERAAWARRLVVVWLVVPLLVALVESYAGQSIFVARNLLVSLPAVALILALGLCDPRLPAMVAVGGLVALLALRALQLWPSYGVSPEDWRSATAYVQARAAPGDCVAFYPADGRMAFQYYGGASGKLPPSVLPATPWGRAIPFVEDYATLSARQLSAVASRCRRLWLVSSHKGQPGGTPASKGNYARYRRLERELAGRFPVADPPRDFGYAAPVEVALFVA